MTVRGGRVSAGQPVVHFVVLTAVLGALVYAHLEGLRGMVAVWNGTPMYSFGYIVPFVSAFLLWTRRDVVAGVSTRPAPLLASLALTFGISASIAGHLAGVQTLQQLAFLASLVGAVLLLFGVETLRRTWVGFAYLLLMIPFWEALTEPLHLPFQVLSARVGVWMLRFVGVPAYCDRVLVYLPNVTLEVARACSGVNYVVAVVALGIPLSYLYLPVLWRRIALILGAIVIAAISNSLRVGLIGLLAYWEIGSPLHGPFHVLHGLFVSGIGYVVLFVGLRLLTPRAPASASADGQPPPSATLPPWRSFSLRTAGSLAALFLIVGALPMRYEPRAIALAGSLKDLPVRIGAWAAAGELPVDTTWCDGADNQLHRRYSTVGLPSADVSVSYFEAQRQGRKLVSYRGDALHRAATALPSELVPESAEVNLVRLRLNGEEKVGIFWYEIDGAVVSGKYRAKWLTLWNTVAHGRGNGAFVLVLGERVAAGAEAGQIEALRRLSTGIHQALQHLIPGRSRSQVSAPSDAATGEPRG